MRLGSPRLRLFAFFALLAVVHTWPLAAHPGYWSRLDSADASLNTWAIAWVAHTLPFHPTHLFDANIFYPARLTFAYSEPLVVQGLLALPVIASGGSPVLAYNIVELLGFTLTAWATGLLVLRATGSLGGAAVAGSAAAFNAHTLMRLPHLQAVHLEFLPLALVALDELAADARARHALLLAVAVALQGLASIYALAFTGWAAVSAVAARPWPWSREGAKAAAWLVGAGLLAVLLLAPVLYPYYEVSHSSGLVRGADEARKFSSTWTDYAFTGARLHYDAWSAQFQSSADANFPGVIVTALALVAVITGLRTNRHTRMAAGIVAGAVLLSVWPRLPGFDWAHDHVPLVSALRGYSRAGQVALVAMGILAGLGAARIEAAWGARRHWPVVAGLLLLLVNGEALRAPLQYVPFTGIASAYDLVANQGHGAVLELPLYAPGSIFLNAPYMVSSTRHWRPLVNGYSGFVPPDYESIYRTLHDFPSPASVAWLRDEQVTTVVLHRAEFEHLKGARQRELVEQSGDLTLVGRQGDIEIFQLR